MVSAMTSSALVIEYPDSAGQPVRRSFAAAESPVTIGREPDCGVVLDTPRCSARHASLEWAEGGWMLTDTSAGGTRYNGVELRWGERIRLSHGDLLGIGEVELTIYVEADRSAVAAETSAASPVSPVSRDAAVSSTPASSSVGLAAETGAERSPLDRLLAGGGTPLGRPRLRFHEGGAFVREIPLADDGASVVIGRDPSCDVVAPDPFRVVSKRHARIYREWAGVFLQDLSQHGVYINGERVQNIAALQHGDRITLSTVSQGSWGPVLIYAETDAPLPDPLPQAAPAAPTPAPPSARLDSAPAPAAGARASIVPTDTQGSHGPVARAQQSPRVAAPAGSNLVIYIALGIAALAVLAIAIAALLFFGKP